MRAKEEYFKAIGFSVLVVASLQSVISALNGDTPSATYFLLVGIFIKVLSIGEK